MFSVELLMLMVCLFWPFEANDRCGILRMFKCIDYCPGRSFISTRTTETQQILS
jgi:hypothetical protein